MIRTTLTASAQQNYTTSRDVTRVRGCPGHKFSKET
jgi:hypothetical protein